MATDGFNKGEWSEMYVFIKLIKDNKVYFGNELHKPTNEFVEIIKLSTNGSSTEISRVDDASIAISDKYDSKISKTIKIGSIVNVDVLAKIKTSIESGNARSFSGPIELIESILTPLGINKLKAEAKVKVAEAKAKQANTQVQTKIVTKIVKIQEKANVAKESIRRNKEVINQECKLSDEAISAYNFSITKTKPQEKK